MVIVIQTILLPPQKTGGSLFLELRRASCVGGLSFRRAVKVERWVTALFCYSPHRKEILHDVSFTAMPGQTVALVRR